MGLIGYIFVHFDVCSVYVFCLSAIFYLFELLLLLQFVMPVCATYQVQEKKVVFSIGWVNMVRMFILEPVVILVG